MRSDVVTCRILSASIALAAAVGWQGCTSSRSSLAAAHPRSLQVEAEPARGNAEKIPLAVTIDDLPFVGPTPRAKPTPRALGRIAEALERQGVPATGFVVCSRLDADRADSLDDWRRRGLAIGNHSTTHRDVNDIPLSVWADDVRHCRERLAQLTGSAPRYFRYPFLRTGSERHVRDEAAQILSDMGHVRAPVSIDTSEWVLAEPYARATLRGDDARARAIAEAYLQHLRLAARHYRRVARMRAGREIRQVLLLHANAVLSDHVDRVIAMLRSEGFRFVSLDEALEDPFYEREDVWVDPVGASWLYRVAPGDLEGWSWDRGQERALEARFGMRPDEPTRIGRALSVRPLEDAPAWVVTHEEPISANSLVFVAADGSPIVADTPWTPAATRELLDWLELRFGRPPALATISHYHFDAAGGIEPLVQAGVEVVASTETARLLAERGKAMRTRLAEQYGPDFAGWQVASPSHTFDPKGGYTARVGGTDVQIFFPGGAHSLDNVVTWFPESRLLFGGCMVKGGDSLGYLGDADLDTYPSAVDALHALRPRIVVPGHGGRTDVEQLDNTRRLLARENQETSPSPTP